jgi:hypothetical protein
MSNDTLIGATSPFRKKEKLLCYIYHSVIIAVNRRQAMQSYWVLKLKPYALLILKH